MTETMKLLPCPFCGGEADFECIASPDSLTCTWSVGCQNVDEDCIGYQVLAHFSRKSEAAEAWNKRASASQSTERDRVLEEAARVEPEKPETFSYQAAGYADGWFAAVKAFRAAFRAMKDKK